MPSATIASGMFSSSEKGHDPSRLLKSWGDRDRVIAPLANGFRNSEGTCDVGGKLAAGKASKTVLRPMLPIENQDRSYAVTAIGTKAPLRPQHNMSKAEQNFEYASRQTSPSIKTEACASSDFLDLSQKAFQNPRCCSWAGPSKNRSCSLSGELSRVSPFKISRTRSGGPATRRSVCLFLMSSMTVGPKANSTLPSTSMTIS